jgi:hypothetical protein
MSFKKGSGNCVVSSGPATISGWVSSSAETGRTLSRDKDNWFGAGGGGPLQCSRVDTEDGGLASLKQYIVV